MFGYVRAEGLGFIPLGFRRLGFRDTRFNAKGSGVVCDGSFYRLGTLGPKY